MKFKYLAPLLCGAALASFASQSFAQGPNPLLVDKMPMEYLRIIKQHQKNLESLDNSEQAKGLYSTLVLWPANYPKLRVCFFGGSKALRQLIAKTATDWMDPEVGIKLDFGKNNARSCTPGKGPEMQIRVSFDKPGYWSQLGQMSVIYATQDQPSLNLQDFDKYDPSTLNEYAYSTIRHEFGHALGIFHEHQNPRSGCENEYNWEYIYEYLSGPPNNWDKEQIDFNLRPINVEGLMATKFDRRSVMLYQFEDKFYLKGKESHCYVPEQNVQLSRVDKALLKQMYPADASSRMQAFEDRKKRFEAIWNKPSEEGRKGVMIDMAKAFFGGEGTEQDVPEAEGADE
jgi:hypothetical protein